MIELIGQLYRFQKRAIGLIDLQKSQAVSAFEKHNAVEHFVIEFELIRNSLKKMFGPDPNIKFILSHIDSLVIKMAEVKDCTSNIKDYNNSSTTDVGA